ncbi:MAG: FAD:protein FMN transferase [Candidatus Methylomirabilales bacterium]
MNRHTSSPRHVHYRRSPLTGTPSQPLPLRGGGQGGGGTCRAFSRVAWHAFLVGCLAVSSCIQKARNGTLVTFTGPTMGTEYTVKISNLPTGVGREGLQADIERILKRVNDRMSTYLKSSELSRFNRQRTTDWVAVSAETVLVIDEALRVSRLTDGAFDITVGPVVNLWGFGPAPREEAIPSDDAIQKALQRVGYAHIDTRKSPPAIKKHRADVEIDLSAIAKGYAVDQVAEHLGSVGISNYLVEIGGEIRGKGQKTQATPWKVGIEKPMPNGRAVQRVASLEDQAMATSGDYRNFFERNGERFSHTINPRTGRPITHTLASVTVIDPSSMHADAMATALMVLGPEAGYEVAERENLAALFIIRDSDGFREKSTPAMKQSLLR